MITFLQTILSWIIIAFALGIPVLIGVLCVVAPIVADTDIAREAGVGKGN